MFTLPFRIDETPWYPLRYNIVCLPLLQVRPNDKNTFLKSYNSYLVIFCTQISTSLLHTVESNEFRPLIIKSQYSSMTYATTYSLSCMATDATSSPEVGIISSIKVRSTAYNINCSLTIMKTLFITLEHNDCVSEKNWPRRWSAVNTK